MTAPPRMADGSARNGDLASTLRRSAVRILRSAAESGAAASRTRAPRRDTAMMLARLAAILIAMMPRRDVVADRRMPRFSPDAGPHTPDCDASDYDLLSPPETTAGRALIVVENAPVPADRRVWQEALSLRRAGWEVTVLAPRAHALGDGLPDEILDGIRIRRFALRLAEDRRVFGHIGEYLSAMWAVWRELRRLAAEQP